LAYEHYNFHSIYQKIHNFCAVDMGSFYLDIIKDRQYTTPKNSLARRSCQTAMYHIVQALTRWLAPILSFTAEEIWRFIPDQTNESIFLETWYIGWPDIKTIDMNFWQQLKAVRDEVNKALEAQRQQGVIGSALAAKVTLYAGPKLNAQLTKLGEELRFLLITSFAEVKFLSDKPNDLSVNAELDLAITVEASTSEKCARCWHRADDIGSNPDYADLCLRCTNNINGNDEVRIFA
jgi:isoleucyl-tRNA synthetase